MKHIRHASKIRIRSASELSDFFDDLACEINPDKDKCEPEKDWPW